jgi:hypothetical protein
MTVESCVNFCKTKNPLQGWAGVEYARECYCATALPAGTTIVPQSNCNMLCRGNNKEFCGGSLTLNVYKYQPSPIRRGTETYQGMFAEA